jgi:predicted DNA-binding protein (UPF0251 family)
MGAIDLVISGEIQAVLIVQHDGTRVVELPDERDVVLGEARLRRRGATLEATGAIVNGDPITTGARRLISGDVLEIGELRAIAVITRGMHRKLALDPVIERQLAAPSPPEPPPPPPPAPEIRVHLAEIERAAIVAALEATHGNQTQAAMRLGISRRTLIYRLEKYGLKKPPARPAD